MLECKACLQTFTHFLVIVTVHMLRVGAIFKYLVFDSSSCLPHQFRVAGFPQAGKVLVDINCMFCYFPMWYPGSGVLLDCIVS